MPTWRGAMTSEMLEKARAEIAAHRCTCTAYHLTEFAQSAVRDAVRELEPFLEHRMLCQSRLYDGKVYGACTCGLAALRQKFGVEG